MSDFALTRAMLEARIHQVLDEIEAEHADEDDYDASQMVLDWMAMMYEVMGRIVGGIDNEPMREQARAFAYRGLDWVFLHAVERTLVRQDIYK